MDRNVFNVKRYFETGGKRYNYYSLKALEENKNINVKRLPYSIRVLLESVLRQYDGWSINEEHVLNLVNWNTDKFDERIDVPFKPARVLLQDFTGVPAMVDFASMRKAIADIGGDPKCINPNRKADLVIDHSVQVDKYASGDALSFNMDIEFERNEERYRFLSWAQKAFSNFRVVPPATGIVHQVNLEYLAQVVFVDEDEDEILAYPDTLVGTDSHTTMINGLGILGWGVGGIEAEAGMLGKASYFPVPDVVGVKLAGRMKEGATATDLALLVTHVLRKHGVVGKFVEYFGEGVSTLSLADRATVSNMAPEYGATCGFFPVDEETMNYLKLTGRKKEHIELVERYCRENLMFRDSGSVPEYSEIVEIDLGEVEACLAGPKRPQDIIPLSLMKEEFDQSITREKGYRGFGLSENIVMDGDRASIKNGSVVIAAITSCTNTSNPFVLIGAGLLAKKACELGLEVPPHVKTSLAPGSKVVTAYLRQSGLLEYLERLGFGVVGYGCTTCIGNSGPLRREVEDAIKENDLLVASVLSGNRNFEGRIHPLVKANYLASPPLVVAYALAGSMTVDLYKEPLGRDKNGQDVYLKDIWPTNREIEEIIQKVVASDLFAKEYEDVYEGNKRWNEIADDSGELYGFDEESTYIQNPPFFEGLKLEVEKIKPLENLRVVGMFGDYVTTDHISPAGSISEDSPAGKYLLEKGVKKESFNSYGSRRGNHEVMMRGTLANIRLNNKLAGGKEGGFTRYFPTGEVTSIYNACMRYKQEGVGLVVIAGEGYGMGSSRDWAAKGVALLGVKAVIAKSYERIHRSNLALMGVLPLQFREGESAESLELTGEEVFTIHVDDHIKPRSLVKVTACDKDGNEKEFEVLVRFDSEVEIDYYRHGGILSMVLREKLNG